MPDGVYSVVCQFRMEFCTYLPISSGHLVIAWRHLLTRLIPLSRASYSSRRPLVRTKHSGAPFSLPLFLQVYIGDCSGLFGWVQMWILRLFSDWLFQWWSCMSWSCHLFFVDVVAKEASVSAIFPHTSRNLTQVLLWLPSAGLSQHLLHLPCRTAPRWCCHTQDGVLLVIWREGSTFLHLGLALFGENW